LNLALRCARKIRPAAATATGLCPALRCAALRCAALRRAALRCAAQENMNCDCGCDWAESCAALRKKSTTCGCDCDWAEPCAALRKKV
jgi:hypothetical protein